MIVVSALLTCQPEERCFAEAVRVSVSKQVEAGQRGVQEETGLCEGLEGVVPRHPGISTKNECGRVPECLILFPLGEPQLAAGARIQEEVWSMSCFKRNTRCICKGESRTLRHEQQQRGEECRDGSGI